MAQYNFLDLTGQPFGFWTVLERAPGRPHGQTYWICQCICGTVKPVYAASLRNGKSLSCGCRRAECTRQVKRTHGMTETPEYQAWQQMKRRCLSAYMDNYARYGGRGIQVCDAWIQSFEAFYAAMGPKPGSDYSLERLDNNGHYTPENTIWATDAIQRRNKRNTHVVAFQGQTYCLADVVKLWARMTGYKSGTLMARYLRGWSIDAILTTPPQGPLLPLAR